MKWINIWRHFRTITEHKILVMKNCFRVGLYRQGLFHDMSKYSPEEFWTGVKFYQGTRSPNAAEREVYGFSKAWLHHKGRNNTILNTGSIFLWINRKDWWEIKCRSTMWQK